MSSIILNSLYRALLKIDENTGIKTMTVKDLAVMLIDELYPEDGVISLEDHVEGNFRLRMSEEFLARIRAESLKGKDMTTIVDEAMAKGAPKPEEVKQEAEIPVVEAVPEVKEVTVKAKEAKPKAAKEPKVTVSKEEKEAAKAAEKAAKEAAKAAEKAAKEEAKAAEKAAKEAEKAAKPKKAAFVGNIEKLNPTQTKLWKKTAEEAKVELTADHLKQFLAQMNALDNTVYNSKKMEAHMTEFFEPKEEEKTEEEELTSVEFKGKEYWVNADRVVFETIVKEDGSEIEKKVGMVGMAEFADMEMP